eukprot:gene513-545_t
MLLIQVPSSGAVYPLDALPDFYRLGYALPYYHVVQGSRAILLHSVPTNINLAAVVYVLWAIPIYVIYAFNCFDIIRKVKRATKLMEDPSEKEITSRELSRRKSKDFDPQAQLSMFDPTMRPEMKRLLLHGVIAEIGLTAFILIMLLLAVGNTWNPPSYYNRIKIALVDFDHGLVGTTVESYAQNTYSATSSIGFTLHVLNSTKFGSYDDVVTAVHDNHYWGVLVVNTGATARLQSALYNPDASSALQYTTGTAALTLIFDQCRGGSLISNLVQGYAKQLAGITNAVLTSTLLVKSSGQKLKFANLNPAALVSPISLTMNSLHTPKYNGVDASITASTLVMYLGNVVCVLVINGVHQGLADAGVNKFHRIVFKIIHLMSASLVLSFVPAISTVWWGQPMSGGTFFAYWMFLYLGMLVFGGFIFMNGYLA